MPVHNGRGNTGAPMRDPMPREHRRAPCGAAVGVSVEGRRGLVSFDPEYFRKLADSGRGGDVRATFRHAYLSNHWGGASPSGPGSNREQTRRIASWLPHLCARLGVRRLLDLPCGDFTWMSGVDLGDVAYIGADIVPEVVASNAERYAAADRRFVEVDLVSSSLPAADLLLCRDCLVHLSFADALAALGNIARSEIGYVLTTTFPAEVHNLDITTGDWRPLNLTRAPFDLPAPVEVLSEGCTENAGAFSDKSLALWRRTDLAAPESRADAAQ